MTASAIEFIAYGQAATAGSKIAHGLRRKDGSVVCRANGSPLIVTRDDSGQRGKVWRSVVQDAARAAYSGELLTGPLRLRVTFVVPRPKGHFGSGRNSTRVKSSAPARPLSKPDLLKLARAVEDGLTGVLYRDDSQIVEEVLDKWFGEPACAIVRLEAV